MGRGDCNTCKEPVLGGGSLITGIQMSTAGSLVESEVTTRAYTNVQKYSPSHETICFSFLRPSLSKSSKKEKELS